MGKGMVLVLGLVLLSSLIWAKEAKTASNRDLALSFYDDVINKHNVEAVDKYVAENMVDHNPDPGQKPGKAGVKEAFAASFRVFRNLRLKPEFTVCEGDKVVTRFTMFGTQKGAFMGVPASGKKFKITGIDILRFEDGKIVERWGNVDALKMMQDLSADKK